jgi:hypothetical protein
MCSKPVRYKIPGLYDDDSHCGLLGHDTCGGGLARFQRNIEVFVFKFIAFL